MGGLIIAEIQQNSNTTYRVYDWNRLGADGKLRPLHIEKALDVINFDQVEPTLQPPKTISETNGVLRQELCQNQYFVVEKVSLAAGSRFEGSCDGRSLEIWGILEGQTVVNEQSLTAVQFTLLPAALGPYTVTAQKDSILLRTYSPSPITSRKPVFPDPFCS
jgi:mannose-6-phosphate isomerase